MILIEELLPITLYIGYKKINTLALFRIFTYIECQKEQKITTQMNRKMSINKRIAEAYLKFHGITSDEDAEPIINGFDLKKPVYVTTIWPNDKLFQFVRNASSVVESETGRWFCLKGATMNSLSIFSGLSGRRLKEFRVKHPIVVLEGVAEDISTDWAFGIGRGIEKSSGGGTQIFIPRNLLFSLEAVGSQT